MRPSLRQEFEAIRTDRTHGASSLTQRAVWVLGEIAGSSEAGAEAVREAADELIASRPDMAAVANGVRRFLSLLAADHSSDASKGPSLAAQVIEEIVHRGAQAASQAAALLPQRGLVLTCSYSSTVVRTLVRAVELGRTLRVLALPSAGYGQQLVEELVRAGVAASVVHRMPPATKPDEAVGLIGADEVVAGESIVNGAPSLGLARWCADRHLALYAVCDSLKLIEPARRLHPLPRGLERVPSRLVTAVITEAGPLAMQRTVRRER